MGQPPGSGDADQQATELLRLAWQLRQAAVDAARADVVAKVDEAIALVAGENGSGRRPQRDSGGGKAGTVTNILDGLGF